MNESPPSPPAIHAQPWAVRIGSALLAAFVLIIALTYFDNAHRRQLETVLETTAVGDTHYFQPPDPAKLPGVAATLDGRPLYIIDAKPFDARDTHTRHVGHDPASGVEIYELSAAATDAERERLGRNRRAFLLK